MSNKVIALLNSHIEGDDEQFLSLALQCAAEEARAGHVQQAQMVKDLVQKARDRRRLTASAGRQAPVPLARARADLEGVVSSSFPTGGLASMVLAPSVEKRLQAIVRQQENRAALRDSGQVPETHLLLVGAPGTGKTMTASALAGQLHLPLFTVRLESVFSRFFGETAAKLRLLFDQIAQMRGVYLLDEFDALGAQRSQGNDVGEVRRVLNAVLGFMEEPNSTDSLVIAATNHSGILDGALARRFDDVIEYELPSKAASKTILERRLGRFKVPARSWPKLYPALEGLSPAEIGRAADRVVKEAILDKAEKLDVAALTTALKSRQDVRGKFSGQNGR